MRCIIIYEKPDGKRFIRTYNYDYGRKIGDVTSMGWKVLNVLYEYEGNYYQYSKYIKQIRVKAEMSSEKKLSKLLKNYVYKRLELKLRKMQMKSY